MVLAAFYDQREQNSHKSVSHGPREKVRQLRSPAFAPGDQVESSEPRTNSLSSTNIILDEESKTGFPCESPSCSVCMD